MSDPGEPSEYRVTVPSNPIKEQATQMEILNLLYANIDTVELNCEEATIVFL